MIGENGGSTAADLGLRSFTTEARLDELSFGRGVVDEEGSGVQASASTQWDGENNDLVFRACQAGPEWNDVAISFVEGVPPGTESFTYDPLAKTMVFEIASGSTTANDVIALFEADPQAVADFTLELDTTDGSPNDGSGLAAIGVVETTGGGWTPGVDFTITLADGTLIEIDLSANDGSGLIEATDPVAPPEASGGSATSYAGVTVESTGLDNDLVFQANNLGAAYNGTQIIFQENPGAPAAVVSYTAGVELTFDFDPGVTTAQDIITALSAHAGASADFAATLDGADGSGAETVGDVLTQINSQAPTKLEARLATYGNGIELVDSSGGVGTLTVTRSPASTAAIGLGLVAEGQESRTAPTGSPQVLTGSDVNPLETEGIFTALSRLSAALEANDVVEIERAIELLDQATEELNFVRAELGARQQGLESVQSSLDSENVDLQATLSEDFDTDMVQAVSDYTLQQTVYQAALAAAGNIVQMTLLDYL